jgi:hypothetical protein
VNGKWVMEKIALTKEVQKVRVTLLPGENSIVIYAWNEGSIPPNTATLQVRSGGEVRMSTLKSSLSENAGVTLIFKTK